MLGHDYMLYLSSYPLNTRVHQTDSPRISLTMSSVLLRYLQTSNSIYESYFRALPEFLYILFVLYFNMPLQREIYTGRPTGRIGKDKPDGTLLLKKKTSESVTLNPSKSIVENGKHPRGKKPEVSPAIALLRTPYKRWNYGKNPITDFKNVPKGWNSEDNDIDEK